MKQPARKLNHQPNRKLNGEILVFFLLVMTVALLLTVSSLRYQGAVMRNSRNIGNRQDTTYLADAGLEKGFSAYAANPNYTGETLNLGNGSTVVTVTAGSTANEKILSAISTVDGVSRRVRAKLVTQPSSVAVAFNYAMQAGAGGFTIGNGSQITGSVYSNQNITGGNSSSVTGNASAVGTITNLTVTGTKKTGQPIQPLPAFDAAFWKTKAQAGGTINGNYTIVNNSTIGPLYVTGEITFGNNVTVTIKGPVYAGGNVNFGNGTIIKVDNSLGTSGVMLVNNGTIAFGNNLNVTNNASGANLLIATTNVSNSAISIGNGAGTINAPLYAPNGGISIGNSAHAIAFTANKITVGNNAVVTYSAGLATETYTTGPGGVWTLQKGTYQEY